MTALELTGHDLARILAELPMSTPNRLATFQKTLKHCAAYAISEFQVSQLAEVNNDLARVQQIQHDSKFY